MTEYTMIYAKNTSILIRWEARNLVLTIEIQYLYENSDLKKILLYLVLDLLWVRPLDLINQ